MISQFFLDLFSRAKLIIKNQLSLLIYLRYKVVHNILNFMMLKEGVSKQNMSTRSI